MSFKLIVGDIEEVVMPKKPEAVYETVKNIDIAMEKLADEAEKTKREFLKYSASNAGDQFFKATQAMVNLSKKIADYAMDMNSVQHQVCDFLGEHVILYEMRTSNFQRKQANITAATNKASTQQFEYRAVGIDKIKAALVNFKNAVERTAKEIQKESEDVKALWNDPQYKRYKRYVDECVDTIRRGTREVIGYVLELEKYQKFMKR
jgi:hypothetical protein